MACERRLIERERTYQKPQHPGGHMVHLFLIQRSVNTGVYCNAKVRNARFALKLLLGPVRKPQLKLHASRIRFTPLQFTYILIGVLVYTVNPQSHDKGY